MKIKMYSFRRTAYVAIAFILAVAGVAQGVFYEKAYAAFAPDGGQLVDREITMSSSAPDEDSVAYRVAFLPASDYAVQGIIVDFCDASSTPILGDSTCNAPADFSVGTPTVDTTTADSGYTALGNGTGSWTATSLNSGRTLKLENANGPTLDDANATRYMFTITTVNNPSATGTFYARIMTYTSGSGDIDAYAPGDEGDDGTLEDYGGIALSTANVINITAKVQETLVFCVSGGGTIGAGCTSGVTSPNLVLGHGPNLVLDDTTEDVDSAFMQASTNAQSGINVRMKNSNACGGLSRNAGATCEIAAVGDTAVDLDDAAGDSALFGLRVVPGTGITAATPYNGAANFYGLDNSTTNNEVTSTYGSLIASSSGALSNIESELIFAATATVTTPAGLYSANMTIIATGTF